MKISENFCVLGFEIESDRLDIARSLLPVIILSGILAGIVELITRHYIIALTAGVASLLAIPVWLKSHSSERWHQLAWYFWLVFLLIIVFMTNTQLHRLESLIWSPLTPLLFFLLAGGSLGALLSSLSLISFLASYYVFPLVTQIEPIPPYEFFQVIGVYITTALLAYRYEKIRSHNRNLLLVQADRDFLTKLLNRRGLQKYLKMQLMYAENTKTPFSYVMFDLDNFKSINDRFGHDVGDNVLTKVAEITKNSLRATDFIGRWGGEEFSFILNMVEYKNAALIAEKLCENIRKTDFGIGEAVTISVGLTEYQTNDNIDSIVKRADVALYQAKQTGKDRIVSV